MERSEGQEAFFKLKVIVSSFKFSQKAKAIAVTTKFVTVLRMLYLVHKFTSVTANFFFLLSDM